MTWEEWKTELNRLGDGIYGSKGPVEECGEDCWRPAFDDGMSPQEAIDEDISHADME